MGKRAVGKTPYERLIVKQINTGAVIVIGPISDCWRCKRYHKGKVVMWMDNLPHKYYFDSVRKWYLYVVKHFSWKHITVDNTQKEEL